jgi:hypothetical protein
LTVDGAAGTIKPGVWSDGQHFFANENVVLWGPSSGRFRMSFANPVTAVRLDAMGIADGSRARLEVYDSNHNLLARYTTEPLGFGDVETMTLERPAAEISYAVAKIFSGQAVGFDNLHFGAETETTTDLMGAYSISGLPAGQYRVEARPPMGGAALTTTQTVNLAEGEALDEVDFGGKSTEVSWQNPANAMDVSGDGMISPLDVLMVINYINANPSNPALPPAPTAPPPYYDVDGNGIVSPLDVLIVINELNDAAAGSATSSSVPSGEGPPSEGPAEGEPVLAVAAIHVFAPDTGPLLFPASPTAARPSLPALHDRAFDDPAFDASPAFADPSVVDRLSVREQLPSLEFGNERQALLAEVLGDLARDVAGIDLAAAIAALV